MSTINQPPDRLLPDVTSNLYYQGKVVFIDLWIKSYRCCHIWNLIHTSCRSELSKLFACRLDNLPWVLAWDRAKVVTICHWDLCMFGTCIFKTGPWDLPKKNWAHFEHFLRLLKKLSTSNFQRGDPWWPKKNYCKYRQYGYQKLCLGLTKWEMKRKIQ